MQYYPFDSRNSLYKSHIGASAAGETLRLRLLLHRDAHVHKAFLLLCRDGEPAWEIPMSPAEELEDYRFYDCEITPSEGLYFYAFRYDSDYGCMSVTKTETSLGTVSDKGVWWQQTVYDSDFHTPDWLKGGIIYQIFPDRFFFGGKPKENIPTDRFLQKDPLAQPAFLQNGEPRSLGNDYYGGDLDGVRQKLPYLQSLGVSCIYFNPIFEAHSNHRYNTANYLKIDPLLGTEEDLKALCADAEKYGIYVILDGVFSHTGHDSVYFNKRRRYGTEGAYNSESSPYRSWFNFSHWPDSYSCWWGVPSLPETDENDPSFSDFITGNGGVLQKWLDCGIKGWRLDVADELPDEFLDKIRHAVKAKDKDAYILGEVWEDATNKISYGARRRFIRGKQLDSVMNYPLADAIIKFCTGGDADKLLSAVENILENYPSPAVNTLFNHLGTHDTARILTRLGTAEYGNREWQSTRTLSEEEYRTAKNRLFAAAVLQYTLPGVPSVYYGDEAGMQGFGDPFCRGAYPWGREDKEILNFYISLGQIRRNCTAFADGEFNSHICRLGIFSFIRQNGDSAAFIAVNRWHCEDKIPLPNGFSDGNVLMGNVSDGYAVIPPFGAVIVKKDCL